MEKFEIISDKRRLSCTIFKPSEDLTLNPLVLFLHAWGSSQQRYSKLAEALAKKGFVCLTFDMSGHGKSEGEIGKLAPINFQDDILAVYNFLTNINGVNFNGISVVGSSFGAYMACLLASKKLVTNMVLRAPADYPNEKFKQPKLTNKGNSEIWEWRSTPRSYNESFALEAVHNFAGNILIIESEKDNIVPHQTIQNYIDAVENPDKLTYMIMKGAPHSLGEYEEFQEQYKNLLIDWLQQKVFTNTL